MLIFNDPATVTALMVASTVAAAGTQIIGAQAEAADARAQADAEKIASRRELRDEQENNRRQLARTRALMSARGADLGTILSITSAQGGESMIRQQRIKSDRDMRVSSLRARASNARSSGYMKAGGSLLSGGASIAQYKAG